jgi:ABC-type transport system substrate-binding protein
LNFIILLDSNAAFSALLEGKCDILDPTVHLDGQVGLLQQLESQGQAKLITAQTMTMEWLGIGVSPSAYDDGVKSQTDRPDFFGDARMRQALAYCLDRQKVVDTVLFGLSQAPDKKNNLKTYFYTEDGVVELFAVDGISFEVYPGSQNIFLYRRSGWGVLGLVGESGCGKSVTSFRSCG